MEKAILTIICLINILYEQKNTHFFIYYCELKFKRIKFAYSLLLIKIIYNREKNV